VTAKWWRISAGRSRRAEREAGNAGCGELDGVCRDDDAERAKAFYAGTLGLRLIAEEPWAAVFGAQGTVLRVQKVQQMVAAPHTVLGWQVPDIGRAIAALREQQVRGALALARAGRREAASC
jgi:catechol 2,3-dioxygenase-like lactoylglutathione lyase family enzyme